MALAESHAVAAQRIGELHNIAERERWVRQRALAELVLLLTLLLLLLLLTPNKILKKTENRVLLSVPEWGPSTAGKDQKRRKLKKTLKKTYNGTKRLENTDEKENAGIERAPER